MKLEALPFHKLENPREFFGDPLGFVSFEIYIAQWEPFDDGRIAKIGYPGELIGWKPRTYELDEDNYNELIDRLDIWYDNGIMYFKENKKSVPGWLPCSIIVYGKGKYHS